MNTLIVAKNPLDPVALQLREMLRARVRTQNPVALSFDNLDRNAAPTPADLAVVVLGEDEEKGLEVLRTVRQWTRGHLFAAGQVGDSRLILRALQCGADYFLDQDSLEAELELGLSRVKIRPEAQAPTGRLIAVLSASGGTGASTLAANLATVFAREAQKCVLIDLKPGRGDLGSLLDLKPQFTMSDLCQNAGRLDRTMFEKMLVRHMSGVFLLGSPQRFIDIRRVTPAGVGQGLEMARTFFPYVVADLEDCFHEEQVVALRQTAGVLLVTRLDFTSLRNARRILEHAQDLEIPPARIQVVVSRFGQPNELPVEEAEHALGQKLAYFVPEDPKTVNGANNAGIPVVQRAPNAKVSMAIAQIACVYLQRRREDSPALVLAET